MLLDHDSVHCLGISESQETETSRATSSTVSHHSAFLYLSKLRKVVLQRFYVIMLDTLYLA